MRNPWILGLAFASIGWGFPEVVCGGQLATDRHVVVVIWDGLRPDSVDETTTPTLSALAARGVFFERNHAAYPSSTEVNGSCLATGAPPAVNGVMSNHEYRREIDRLRPIDTERLAAVRKGDQISGGHYLRLPTIAERVQAVGQRTAVAGTKPVALLLDRAQRTGVGTGGADRSVDLFEGYGLPVEAADAVAAAFGAFPPMADPTRAANTAQDSWTTHGLTDVLWAEGVPMFSMLWLSEPDFGQHGSGPGSAVAKAGLKSSDGCLARVLRTLQTKGVLETTDVLVVSDHGFSTISSNVNMVAELQAAGFDANDRWDPVPTPGQVLVVGMGGSVLFYVEGHDEPVERRLVAHIQSAPFASVIMTRRSMDGTFTLNQAQIDTPDAPDIVVSLRWTDEASITGVRGMLMTSDARKPGQGMHASLSPFDMHNTLIAAGPSFRVGFRDELPSGNIDVAPTVLHILGVPGGGGGGGGGGDDVMKGRVLMEALRGENGPPPEVKTTTIQAKAKRNGKEWEQYLKVSTCGGVTYVDEGDGSLKSGEPPAK
jgi:arylsulfatase A-like enzyme